MFNPNLLPDTELDEVLSLCSDIQKQCSDIMRQCLDVQKRGEKWLAEFDKFLEELK